MSESIQELRERIMAALSYNPETGEFRWKVARGGVSAGTLASNVGSEGYIRIGIFGKLYFAHRLAWLFIHGEWPKDKIDHVNRVKTDNRITNLRVVSDALNRQNVFGKRNRKSALVGAYFTKGAWQASIGIGGRKIYLGRFETEQAASAAYMEAKRKLHPIAFDSDPAAMAQKGA